MTYQQLLKNYQAKHGALVRPVQGWSSLCDELHLAYSMGRKRGFTDLGTYVNKPLDHGGLPWARHAPAWAFDLGRSDKRFWQRQWGQLMSKRFCNLLIDNHKALNIEYVIYRDRIWSRAKGWHYYGPDKSHFWHIHVSGHWPGRGET